MYAAPASCAATTVRSPSVSVIAGMNGSFIPPGTMNTWSTPSATSDRITYDAPFTAQP